jgi:hypothetical protein
MKRSISKSPPQRVPYSLLKTAFIGPICRESLTNAAVCLTGLSRVFQVSSEIMDPSYVCGRQDIISRVLSFEIRQAYLTCGRNGSICSGYRDALRAWKACTDPVDGLVEYRSFGSRHLPIVNLPADPELDEDLPNFGEEL